MWITARPGGRPAVVVLATFISFTFCACVFVFNNDMCSNELTQGLLDLAKEEGYLFEDFTFAAIRDRIRCYYKSYVQATKKKKKRKRGGF